MLNLLLSDIDTARYQAHAIENFADICRRRAQNTHKGTFGTVGVIGGSKGMTGAALLAGTAALYGGCGKVFVGLNQLPAPVAAAPMELMIDAVPNIVIDHGQHIDTWVVGCGLGCDDMAVNILQGIWNDHAGQLVVDADALCILGEHSSQFPHTKRQDVVLTPHPGEAAQLLDTSVGQIEGNRLWAARELSSRYRAWVVLKGHETVISSPRGAVIINKTGNAGLATAGSGDVLAGLIGSLLAQGVPADQAVPAGVWLHGAAADILVRADIGPIGLLASELATTIRWLRNRITSADLPEYGGVTFSF